MRRRLTPMPAQLDHLLVPASDRVAAASLVAGFLGAPWAEQGAAGPFSPVYLKDGLTLDFDQWDGPIPSLHFAFRVPQAEFDAILGRVRAAGIAVRSTPGGPDDGRVNTALGGSRVYWNVPDGHVWELLTASDARPARDR